MKCALIWFQFNGPFPSCLLRLSQNKSKQAFALQVHFNVNRTHFHMKALHARTRFETEAQGSSEMAY